MKDKRCDLHIHSKFSDSDTEVEDIFKQAREKGLSCISITDHDTIDGISPALICSKAYNIELIEGVELSAEYKEAEVHILGYFVNFNDERLNSVLSNLKKLRKERILVMTDRLSSLGVKVDEEELVSKIGESIPTRLHLGLHLVEKGGAKSLKDAFRKYLSPGKPGYISSFKYSVKEVIRLIKDCGGLAFLAHPHIIADQSWIEEIIKLGIDGLELVYNTMPAVKSSLYKEMASKFSLLKSGGSDAHGTYKKFTEVGGVNIPYGWVQEMKQRKSIRI